MRRSLHCVPDRGSRPPRQPRPTSGRRGQGQEGPLGAGWGALSPTSSSETQHSPQSGKIPLASSTPVGSTESPTLSDPGGTSTPRPRPRSGHPQHPAKRDPSRKDQPARGLGSSSVPTPGAALRKPNTLSANSRNLPVASTEPSTSERGRAGLSGAESGRVQPNRAEFSRTQRAPNEQSRAWPSGSERGRIEPSPSESERGGRRGERGRA